MRKLAILLALVMALSCCLLMLAACGESDDTSSPASASSGSSSGTETSSASTSSTSSAVTSSAASSSSEAASSAASSEETSSEESEETSEESSAPAKDPNATENPDNSNLAAGKTYVHSMLHRQGGADVNWAWDENADITYPDTGDVELTDGKFPEEGATYTDEAFMGFAAGSPDYATNGNYAYITVDLGDVYALSNLVAYVGTSKLGGGIGVPGTVEFLVSDDGEKFTSVGSVVPKDDPSVPYTAVSLECDVTGQYVQIRMTSSGWMFICEFEAF